MCNKRIFFSGFSSVLIDYSCLFNYLTFDGKREEERRTKKIESEREKCKFLSHLSDKQKK